MTPPPRDGSRDRRIEDPSNLYLIHPASHALLPLALRHGVSANAVSLAGLACGTVAAFAYAQWHDPLMALVGLAFSVAWLVADGLDGMIARATRTASALGRTLDGLCDHGVFALIYLSLAYTSARPGAGRWRSPRARATRCNRACTRASAPASTAGRAGGAVERAGADRSVAGARL